MRPAAPAGISGRRSHRKGGDSVRLSSHILPTAGTMVGVCTTLIGLVKIAEATNGPGLVDKYYGIAALIFLVSAFASYVSMRSPEGDRTGEWLEHVADWCFLVGLIGLATISLLFAYETI